MDLLRMPLMPRSFLITFFDGALGEKIKKAALHRDRKRYGLYEFIRGEILLP